MLKKKTLKLTAALLILVGSYLTYFSAQNIIKRNTPVDFVATKPLKTALEKQNYPISIEFSQLGLNLPVSLKGITNGKWDDPEATIGYWKDSPLPGNVGNSIMYGHNWPNLLAKLPKTQKGDEIKILFLDGYVKEFVVESTYIVTADQKHILDQTEDFRLTIYTCTGFLDSKRFVVVAVPKI